MADDTIQSISIGLGLDLNQLETDAATAKQKLDALLPKRQERFLKLKPQVDMTSVTLVVSQIEGIRNEAQLRLDKKPFLLTPRFAVTRGAVQQLQRSINEQFRTVADAIDKESGKLVKGHKGLPITVDIKPGKINQKQIQADISREIGTVPVALAWEWDSNGAPPTRFEAVVHLTYEDDGSPPGTPGGPGPSRGGPRGPRGGRPSPAPGPEPGPEPEGTRAERSEARKAAHAAERAARRPAAAEAGRAKKAEESAARKAAHAEQRAKEAADREARKTAQEQPTAAAPEAPRKTRAERKAENQANFAAEQAAKRQAAKDAAAAARGEPAPPPPATPAAKKPSGRKTAKPLAAPAPEPPPPAAPPTGAATPPRPANPPPAGTAPPRTARGTARGTRKRTSAGRERVSPDELRRGYEEFDYDEMDLMAQEAEKANGTFASAPPTRGFRGSRKAGNFVRPADLAEANAPISPAIQAQRAAAWAHHEDLLNHYEKVVAKNARTNDPAWQRARGIVNAMKSVRRGADGTMDTSEMDKILRSRFSDAGGDLAEGYRHYLNGDNQAARESIGSAFKDFGIRSGLAKGGRKLMRSLNPAGRRFNEQAPDVTIFGELGQAIRAEAAISSNPDVVLKRGSVLNRGFGETSMRGGPNLANTGGVTDRAAFEERLQENQPYIPGVRAEGESRADYMARVAAEEPHEAYLARNKDEEEPVGIVVDPETGIKTYVSPEDKRAEEAAKRRAKSPTPRERSERKAKSAAENKYKPRDAQIPTPGTEPAHDITSVPPPNGALCPVCGAGPFIGEALYERHYRAMHPFGGKAGGTVPPPEDQAAAAAGKVHERIRPRAPQNMGGGPTPRMTAEDRAASDFTRDFFKNWTAGPPPSDYVPRGREKAGLEPTQGEKLRMMALHGAEFGERDNAIGFMRRLGHTGLLSAADKERLEGLGHDIKGLAEGGPVKFSRPFGERHRAAGEAPLKLVDDKIWRATRKAQVARQPWCGNCGIGQDESKWLIGQATRSVPATDPELRKKVRKAAFGRFGLQAEHIVSRQHGGAIHDPANLQTGCGFCNSGKGLQDLRFTAHLAGPRPFNATQAKRELNSFKNWAAYSKSKVRRADGGAVDVFKGGHIGSGGDFLRKQDPFQPYAFVSRDADYASVYAKGRQPRGRSVHDYSGRTPEQWDLTWARQAAKGMVHQGVMPASAMGSVAVDDPIANEIRVSDPRYIINRLAGPKRPLPRASGGLIERLAGVVEVNERGQEGYESKSGRYDQLLGEKRRLFAPPEDGKIIPHHKVPEWLRRGQEKQARLGYVAEKAMADGGDFEVPRMSFRVGGTGKTRAQFSTHEKASQAAFAEGRATPYSGSQPIRVVVMNWPAGFTSTQARTPRSTPASTPAAAVGAAAPPHAAGPAARPAGMGAAPAGGPAAAPGPGAGPGPGPIPPGGPTPPGGPPGAMPGGRAAGGGGAGAFKFGAFERQQARASARETNTDLIDKLTAARSKVSEGLQLTPARAFSVLSGQISQIVIGGRKQMLERRDVANRLISEAMTETTASTTMNQARRNKAFELKAAMDAAGPKATRTVEQQAGIDKIKQELISTNMAGRAQRTRAEEKEAEATKAAEGVVRPRDVVRSAVSGLVGIVGGTLAFTAAMQLAQIGMEQLTKVVTNAVDAMTGFAGTTARVVTALAPAAKTVSGAPQAGISQVFAQLGISGAGLGQTGAFAQRLAGAQNLQQTIDLLRTEQNLRAQAGRNPSVTPGIGTGFGNGPLAGVGLGWIGQTPGALEQLGGFFGGQKVNPVEQFPLIGALAGVSENLGLGKLNPTGYGSLMPRGPQAVQAGIIAAQQNENLAQIIPVIGPVIGGLFHQWGDNLKKQAESQTDFTSEVGTLNDKLYRTIGDAGKFTPTQNQALLDATVDAFDKAGDKQAGERIAQAGYALVGRNGAAATASLANQAGQASLSLLPSREDLANFMRPQLSTGIGTAEVNAQHQRDTVIPTQLALGLREHPLQPSNVGLLGQPVQGATFGPSTSPVGTNPTAGINEMTAAVDRNQAATKEAAAEGEKWLSGLSTQGQHALAVVTDLGQQIADIDKIEANLQAGFQTEQTNRQIELQKRALGDVLGLQGKQAATLRVVDHITADGVKHYKNIEVEATKIGQLQHDQMMLGRKDQQVQLDQQQRQINFGLALARIGVPGESPAERAANLAYNKQVAQEQQEAHDRAQEMFDIAKKLQDEGIKINIKDAKAELTQAVEGWAITVAIQGMDKAKDNVKTLQDAWIPILNSFVTTQQQIDQMYLDFETTIQGQMNAFEPMFEKQVDTGLAYMETKYADLLHLMDQTGTYTPGTVLGPPTPGTGEPQPGEPGYTPGHARGSWRTGNEVARLHAGEMVIPANQAAWMRGQMLGATMPSSGGGGSLTVIFNNPTVRDDSDLDLIARKVEQVMNRRAASLGLPI